MPDYKLAYIAEHSPWHLDQLGLVDSIGDHDFYVVGTGHPAQEIGFDRQAVMFRATLHHNDAESLDEYFKTMFLEDINHEDATTSPKRRAIDRNMGEMFNSPAIWTQPAGEGILVTRDGEEIVIPSGVHIFERVPFDTEISTMANLTDVLSEITGDENIRITVYEP